MIALMAALQALSLPAAIDDYRAAMDFDYCAYGNDIDPELTALIEERLEGSEREQAAALLVKAGTEIAASQETPQLCRAAFDEGANRFEAALETARKQMGRNTGYRKSRDKAIAEVQKMIADQWLKDQAGRVAYISLQTKDRTGAAFWAQRLATANAVATDAESVDLMRGVLEHYDWIDRERFSPRISSHAWILIQHADDHPDFQEEVLRRMEPYLETGGVKKQEYAYLFDRVAVNRGRPQRYGTQPELECNEDGTLDLRAVEDLENLDTIRAEMNLGPYRNDLDQMASNRCRQPG